MDETSTAAPLDGVRVVEVGNFMAAPFAAMQLADLGADVVKVESPAGGDTVRATGPFLGARRGGTSSAGHSSPFARLNRNKRSIALDLKADAGKDAFRRLLRTADVLVQNLRPGTLDRLGFGYPAVHELNPGLVYVSASGWGQDGPLAALPGLDIMAQARAGLMSITGEPDGGPVKVGVPVCDLVCGLYGALAAVAALRVRERTGEGQHVDVSLYEAGVSLTIWEAGRYFATGEAGSRLGSAHQSTGPYQAVRTRDGWATVGAVTPKTWDGFCAALGLGELHDDPRYASAFDRQARRDSLIPAIERVTTALTTDEFITRLEDAGVPCAPIATTDQVLIDAHLSERGFFWDAPHPELEPVRQLGSPMRLSRTPPVRRTAGPPLGADSVAVLTDCGLTEDEVAELVASGVVTVPGETEGNAGD